MYLKHISENDNSRNMKAYNVTLIMLYFNSISAFSLDFYILGFIILVCEI